MALINCAKVTAGSGGNQYDVTTNIFPNCPAGYVVTTSTYVNGLEAQIAQLQQDIATSQATTLLSQSQLGQCNTLLSNPLTCSVGTGSAAVMLSLPAPDIDEMKYVFGVFFGLTFSVFIFALLVTRVLHFVKSHTSR